MALRYNFKTATWDQRKTSSNKNNTTKDVSETELPWVRPAEWPSVTPPLSSEQKIVMLAEVHPNAELNYVTFTISGNYTVDWGDGTTENFTAATRCQKQYFFDALSLPVTSEGYKIVTITITPTGAANITSVAFNVRPIVDGVTLAFVVSPIIEILLSCPNFNSTTSLIFGGSQNLGSAILIRLRNFIGINMGNRPLAISFGGFQMLENVELYNFIASAANLMFGVCANIYSIKMDYNSTSAVSDFTSMFNGTYRLKKLPLINTSNGTIFTSMMFFAIAIEELPSYNFQKATNISSLCQNASRLKRAPNIIAPSATNTSSVFANCAALETVGILDLRSSRTIANLFQGCTNLRNITQILTTSAVSTIALAFNACSNLEKIPNVIDTSQVVTMVQTFQSCSNLKEIPITITPRVSTFANAFNACRALRTAPVINAISATTMNSIFDTCSLLSSIDISNTQNCRDFGAAFQNCYNLKYITNLETSAATASMVNMFSNCFSLTAVPNLNVSRVSAFTTAFNATNSLTYAILSGAAYTVSFINSRLERTAMENLFTSLGTAINPSQTITITNNPATTSTYTRTCSLTAKSNIISATSTSALAVGMQFTGSGSPLTTPINVTFSATGSLVNLSEHGLENDDEVSFANITTTTGIVTSRIYYVANKATNNFQVASEVGGSALTLTNNGSGTMRYRSEISSITANTAILITRPATSSVTNTSLIFRPLKTGTALLKGWTVTG